MGQGGTNYEAALRRAALMNSDEEDSEEAASESEEEEQAEDPFENIDALSDEEAKEELREAQQRRLMEESQACLLPQLHAPSAHSLHACTTTFKGRRFSMKHRRQ